ncbi:MAG: sigma-70 family RNA polymerase sigma factor [Oscillospiraceae bacterium]|nr:sigma-70 family RNA polymerase sigma factor [Oscillospiraceae bacterium]
MYTDEQFTEYARMYMDTVYRVAFNYLKSHTEADDVTQNTLFKLFRTKKTFESDEHLKHWIIRVAINECKRTAMSPWRKSEPFEDYAATLKFESPEQSELFRTVMDLPEKYRVAILLYYFEDYSIEEISRLLKIPKSTVGTRLKRAREKLKFKLLEA